MRSVDASMPAAVPPVQATGRRRAPALCSFCLGCLLLGLPGTIPRAEGQGIAPAIRFVAPTNGAILHTPSIVPLIVEATDTDGTVSAVRFFAGSLYLGRAAAPPFSLAWTNPPAGSHELFAVAQDQQGLTATSTVASVTVLRRFLPAADAHVRNGAFASQNFGTATSLEVQAGNKNGNHREAFLWFDLAGVSNAAAAQLRFSARYDGSGPSTLGLHTATTNWDEQTITWNNRPTPGALLDSLPVSGAAPQSYAFDLPASLLPELNAGHGALGFALRSPNNIPQPILVASRETQADPPELLVAVANTAPVVSLISPEHGDILDPPAQIQLSALASSPSGAIVEVEFLVDDLSLGRAETPPFEVTWTDVPYGAHQITARATDDSGRVAESASVWILVDAAPVVQWIQPADGQEFVTSSAITLEADAGDPDGRVVSVRFLAGEQVLGERSSPPWSVQWVGAPPGTHTLRAVAVDDFGRTAMTPPVAIAVLPPPSILTHPESRLVVPGTDVTFATSASATGPLNYQWRFNGLPLTHATNSTLELLRVGPEHAGVYDVEVRGRQGSVVSEPARLELSVVAGWGYNFFGQTNVLAWMTNNVVAISGGVSHNLALLANGTVRAWGDDLFGQSTVPSGLAVAVAVSAGERHSLALLTDGTVVGWGNNSNGQLTPPPGLANIVAIDAGRYHSLALRADGTVVAWGWNYFGQATVPPGLSQVVAISTGGDHNLALRSDGTVVAWGWNDYSQTNLPPGLPPVVAIAAGMFHNLLVTEDGRVRAFGNNLSRQLDVPPGLTDVVAVAAGQSHSLALQRGGTVVRWGGDPQFQADLPVPDRLTNGTAISAGQYHSLALLENDGNLPPSVTWIAPTNGTSFPTPAAIEAQVDARDWDGSIAGVTFFTGNEPLGFDSVPPFRIVWNDPPAGRHPLRAEIADNRGAITSTSTIWVQVVNQLSALADAHVRDGAFASSNFGAAPILEVQTGSKGNNRDAFFLFDLAEPGLVTDAILRLHGAASGNASLVAVAFGVPDVGWDESTITWINRPALGIPLGSTTFSGTTPGTQDIDVSQYIRSELAAGRRRIAIALHNNGTSNRHLRIDSREAASNSPQLILSSSNTPPAVTWLDPAPGSIFRAPANLQLSAWAGDVDGTIRTVEFFANGQPIAAADTLPYSVAWTAVPPGSYTLTARALDNSGATRTSAPVVVIVDAPPVVHLLQPADGTARIEPATLQLEADASDPDDGIDRVEFFTGTTTVAIPGDYSFTAAWNQVAAGFYSVHAVAFDHHGLASTSSVARVQVFPGPVDPGPGRIAHWRFDGPTLEGDRGQQPLAHTNILLVPDAAGHAVLLDDPAPVRLLYREVEDDRHPNIHHPEGSLLFRFSPRWASTSAGGSGPGHPAPLVGVGRESPDALHGSWTVRITADGDRLLLVTQGEGLVVTNLAAPIRWPSNQWHQVALTWSPAHAWIQVDGEDPATTGTPVSLIPGPLARAVDGLQIGSDPGGITPARGLLDEIEIFNYALTPEEVALRIDNDRDGLPDSWELRHGLDPSSSAGNDGAEGDPDGDGVSNVVEYRQGRNPVVAGTVPDDGRIALDLFTPLQ